MSVAFVIHGIERSALLTNMPMSQECAAALRTVSMGANSGGWVGPAPRVTKTNSPLGVTGGYITQVAWVWLVDDAQQAALNLTTVEAQTVFGNRLQAASQAALAANASHSTLIGSDWSVDWALYNENINGTMEWWRSGRASTAAVFIDNVPEWLSRMTPPDNPIGPNNPLAQGGGGDPNRTPDLSWLGWLAGSIAVTVVAVQFGPAVATWVPRKTQPKQENPRRNRR